MTGGGRMAGLAGIAEQEVLEAEEVYLEQIGELVRLRCRWDASRQLREALETTRGEELARLHRVSRLVELRAASLKRGDQTSVQPQLGGQLASQRSGQQLALCDGPREEEEETKGSRSSMGNARVEVVQPVPAPLAVAASNTPVVAAEAPESPASRSLASEKMTKRQHLHQLKLRLAKLQRISSASSQAASPRSAGSAQKAGRVVVSSPGVRGGSKPSTPRLRAIAAGGPETDAVDRALQRFLLTGKKPFSPPGAMPPKESATGGSGEGASRAEPPELSIGSSSAKPGQETAPRAGGSVDTMASTAESEEALLARARSKSPVVGGAGRVAGAFIGSKSPPLGGVRTPSPALAPHAPAPRSTAASPERSSAPSPHARAPTPQDLPRAHTKSPHPEHALPQSKAPELAGAKAAPRSPAGVRRASPVTHPAAAPAVGARASPASQKRALPPPLDSSALPGAGGSGGGAAAEGRGPKRARLDPQRMLCPFELHGECADPACPDQHLRDVEGTRPKAPRRTPPPVQGYLAQKKMLTPTGAAGRGEEGGGEGDGERKGEGAGEGEAGGGGGGHAKARGGWEDYMDVSAFAERVDPNT